MDGDGIHFESGKSKSQAELDWGGFEPRGGARNKVESPNVRRARFLLDLILLC